MIFNDFQCFSKILNEFQWFSIIFWNRPSPFKSSHWSPKSRLTPPNPASKPHIPASETLCCVPGGQIYVPSDTQKCSPDTQNCAPDTQNYSPDTQNCSPGPRHTELLPRYTEVLPCSPDLQNLCLDR